MDGDADVVSEWRAAVGGQFEAASHGILDLGWRRGNTSLQLFTETLDLRQQGQWSRGRGEVGFRASALASGMWITPWRDGAPDPTRAQLAPYVGPDVYVERWLPNGLSVGARSFVHLHAYSPMLGSEITLPTTLWTRADLALGGYWNDGETVARLWLGVDQLVSEVQWNLSPHVLLDATHRPNLPLGPLIEIHGAFAARQGPILATRIGGMTPYHPQIAGTAWAEFWVEDFVTTRGGFAARPSDALRLEAFVDVAAWTLPGDDPGGIMGLGGAVAWSKNRWFAQAASGFSPGLLRQPGVTRVAVFALIGSDWRSLR